MPKEFMVPTGTLLFKQLENDLNNEISDTIMSYDIAIYPAYLDEDGYNPGYIDVIIGVYDERNHEQYDRCYRYEQDDAYDDYQSDEEEDIPLTGSYDRILDIINLD